MRPRRQIRKPRVGRIPYLCAAPFHHGWDIEVDGFEVITAPPRQLHHLAEQGELDAACLPVTARRRRDFEPLGEFGVAAPSGPLALLCSRIEPDLLHKAPIGISFEAQSAVQLLEYVLREKYGLKTPHLSPLAPDRSGFGALLLVGDAALRAQTEPPKAFEWQIDLAAAWHELTGHPFTFGRWVVHKELPDEQKEALSQGLDWALTGAMESVHSVVDGYFQATKARVPTSDAVAHVRAVTYRLGESERNGMEHFSRLLAPKPRRRHPYADFDHLTDLDRLPAD